MRIPCATYRLQFNAGFTFDDAREIIDYLRALGIDAVYASPVFKAHAGSQHGYDIIDPNELNPEIGTRQEFTELTNVCRSNGIDWIQDIVPNHMAYSGENRLLIDIMENGRTSRYIDYFDISWDHPYESLKGKLLAPFLGKFYGSSLEDGELQLSYDREGLSINYYQLRLPLRIESYLKVMGFQLSELKPVLGAGDRDLLRLKKALYGINKLSSDEINTAYHEHVSKIKNELRDLYQNNRIIRQFVDRNLSVINGKKGAPDSYNLLESILGDQLFRLSFWKVAAEEINYRRFFNINELISLRVENQEVFDHIHTLIGQLIDEGRFSGLRIDHIDGLYDPARYLAALRKRVGDIPVFVEKILATGEDLPDDWPVQGTTGYDFLNEVNGIFCCCDNEDVFTRIYHRHIGFETDYKTLVVDKKRLIIGKYMAGDIDNLAQMMKNLLNRYRYGNDITLYGLKRALVDVLALFPVYRTYINHDTYRPFDREVVRRVLEKAREHNPAYSNELDFIEDFLSLRFKDYLSQDERDQWLNFVMRFQQFTGPLMAKGVEDTVLYVYNRLLSLNEVGGNPGRFGSSIAQFHQFNDRRLRQWPHSMNATSTHDTKRGEDARARLNVLSEIPGTWRRNLKYWSILNKQHRRRHKGTDVPSRNDEYLLYQTLIGSFPFYEHEFGNFAERVSAFAIKAVREAKTYTAWLKPDEDYEQGFRQFIISILDPSPRNTFLQEFLPFQEMIAGYGIYNSLSQTLLKITSPGTPDFYQGTELWDLSLVDPDNRRAVDFRLRSALLDSLLLTAPGDLRKLVAELLASPEDGRIKLFLIHRALKARHADRDLFEKGSYIPLYAAGKHRDRIVAHLRKHGRRWAMTLVPRMVTRLYKSERFTRTSDIWGNTVIELPEGAPAQWMNAVTGRVTKHGKDKLFVGDILAEFPVALITGGTIDR